MTNLLMLDKTKRHPELRAQVESVLQQVAPLVRETTRLELPSVVTFQLVTPEQWQADSAADMSDNVQRSRMRKPRWQAPVINLIERVSLAKFHQVAPLLGGVLVMGATVVRPSYQSTTMLVPDALRHSGVLSRPEYLAQLIAHELTHQLQGLDTRHCEAWAEKRPSAIVRSGSIKFLVEGHAHWVDQEVTRLLFGKSHDIGDLSKPTLSDVYREADADPRIVKMRSGPDFYKEGLALVRPTMEAVGAANFNRAWTDLALLPTRREVKHPVLWAARLVRLLSTATTGVPRSVG
ncbi:zinc-dependent metalloprotease [Streptomyces sp. NPDC058011]|uniref:zinc-dependent metalloprotease n=1 Tax=Streptomyces sp. NPDC058011 TaxID=3346305 RepID=UPI0036F18BA4